MNNFKNCLQILQAKSQQGWSGRIEIKESQDVSIGWQVYFYKGQIQYIGNDSGQLERLNYLCQIFDLTPDYGKYAKQNASEYQCLYRYLFGKQLSNIKIKEFLFKFTQEGLIHVLSVQKASVRLISNTNIIKSSISFSLEELQLEDRVNSWKQIKQYISSPFNRLYIEKKNTLQFYRICKQFYEVQELSSLNLSAFVNLFAAKYTLYEIAQKAKIDVSILAKHLELAVSENVITLLPFGGIAATKSKTNKKSSREQSQLQQKKQIYVVCIDDSKTVQKQVKMILESVGHHVVGILDPTLAFAALSRKQPDLIFMDVNMPNMNGYELCELLRKFRKLKEVPIIMLTGKDGVSDRLKAKSAGANDYLTKPFNPHELIQCVENLVRSK